MDAGVKVVGDPAGYAFRIKPTRAELRRFWEKVVKGGPDDCWNWVGGMRGAYGEFVFRGRVRVATHVAWLIAHGTLPTLWVLHTCDNRACVNPAHLFEGTCLDNHRDMWKKGRAAPQVRKDWGAWGKGIRRLHAQGATKAHLARVYHVAESLIYAIVYRKLWRHI
jgi:hypothetical protein